MRNYYIIISTLIVLSLFSACTKEADFLVKPTLTAISINTTSAEKTFEIWLDDELLLDSLSQLKNNNFLANIAAGEHRLRISQVNTNDFFVDSLINFAWSSKPYGFSLIELNPQSAPLFFTGFPEDIPDHEEGFVTIAFLNTDLTITKDKEIDILIYDMNDPSVVVADFNSIPYNRISSYSKIPVDIFNNGGFLVIRDTQSQNILLDGRDLWMILNLGFYYPGAANTYILNFNNGGDLTYPYYVSSPIFQATR